MSFSVRIVWCERKERENFDSANHVRNLAYSSQPTADQRLCCRAIAVSGAPYHNTSIPLDKLPACNFDTPAAVTTLSLPLAVSAPHASLTATVASFASALRSPTRPVLHTMSAPDEHDEDDGEQHIEADDNEQHDDDGDTSFKAEAEAAPVTINEWVELDEDEDDDEEFDPDAAGEEDEDEDDEEDDDDVEVDEDEEKALEEAATAEQDAYAELRAAADDEEDAAEDDGEGEGEEEDDEEEDEDEGDVSVLESGAGMMSGAAMSQFVSGVMRKVGPTVTTVLLKADGTREELVSTQHTPPRLLCCAPVLLRH